MADNQDPRRAGSNAPFLADDDPLAELARIVGYDSAKVAAPKAEMLVLPESFDLDLEAELLQSFDDGGDQDGAVAAPAAATSDRDDELMPDEIPAFLKIRGSSPAEAVAPAVMPEPEPVAASELAVPETQEPSEEMEAADEVVAEDWTEVTASPIDRPMADTHDAADVVLDVYADDEQPVEAVEAYEPDEAAATRPEDADAADADFSWETEQARESDEIVRSYEDEDDVHDEPSAPTVVDETRVMDAAAAAAHDSPPHDQVEDISSAETSGVIQERDTTAAPEDAILRDFESYALPEDETGDAAPVAAPAAPSAAHESARRDEWDIADELERAFMELRTGTSQPTAPAAYARPSVETAASADEPMAERPNHDASLAEPQFEDDHVDAGFVPDDLTEAEALPESAALVDLEIEPVAGESAPEVRPDAERVEPQAMTEDDIEFDFADFEFDLNDVGETATGDSNPAVEPVLADTDDMPARTHARADPPLVDSPAAVSRPAPAVAASVAAAAPAFVPAQAAAAPSMRQERLVEEESDLAFDVRDVADTSTYLEPVGEIDVPEVSDEEEWTARPQADDPDLADIEAEFAEIMAQGDMAPRQEEGVAPSQAAAAPPPLDVDPRVSPDSIDFADFNFSNLDRYRGAPLAAADASAPAPLGHQPAVGRDEGQPQASHDTGEDNEAAAAPRRAGTAGSGLPRWKLAAGGVVAAGALAALAFAFAGGSEGGSGEPRLIVADSQPLKIAPENSGVQAVPNQDQAVYEQVDGSGAQETVNLVSRSEEPVDVVQRTIDPQVLPLEGRPASNFEEDVSNASSDQIAAIAGVDVPRFEETAPASAEIEPLAVEPRRVQTMVVRPDGTLVAREPQAAAEGGTTQPETELGEEANSQSAITSDEASSEATLVAAANIDGAQPLPDGGLQPIAAAAEQTGSVPLPQGRPEGETEVASAETDARLTPATTPQTLVPAENGPGLVAPVRTVRTSSLTGDGELVPDDAAQTGLASPQTATIGATGQPLDNPGGYVVQIASQPTEESARSTYQSLAERHANLLGGRPVQIQSAEIADRGTFYRVRVAGGTRDEATDLCERYQAAGGSCFVAR